MTEEFFPDTPLDACPFCGDSDVHLLMLLEDSAPVASNVVCYGCLAVFGQAEATCPEDTAEAWNRRKQNVS
jgi:hypothetical protein